MVGADTTCEDGDSAHAERANMAEPATTPNHQAAEKKTFRVTAEAA
jgi:hypothetical protein